MSVRRGEIYFVDLNPVQGREQAGRRPVLVISNDQINQRPLVVTVVVGTKGENLPRDYPTNVRVSSEESGLPLETVFLGFQIRSLDPKRFPDKPAGEISGAILKKVEDTIDFVLDLSVGP
jgi:mRNA interferase MazF